MKKIKILSIIGLTMLTLNSCKKDKFDLEEIETETQADIVQQLVSEDCERVLTLYAGQTIDAGTVTISNDDDNVYVKYQTTNGWTLTSTHLFVGGDSLDLSEIPVNNGGNPKVGHFPYKETHNSITEYTYTIPVSEIPLECMLIAAKAEVANGNQTEGAWAEGIDFPGGNWAMFSTYCITECNIITPPTENEINQLLSDKYNVNSQTIIAITNPSIFPSNTPFTELDFQNVTKTDFTDNQQVVYFIPYLNSPNKYYIISGGTNTQSIVTINMDNAGNGNIVFDGSSIVIVDGIPQQNLIIPFAAAAPGGGGGGGIGCQQEGNEGHTGCYLRESDEFCDGFLGCVALATQPAIHLLIYALCGC